MRSTHVSPRPACTIAAAPGLAFTAAAVSALALLCPPAHAQAARAEPVIASTEAVAACERAARQALQPRSTDRAELSFDGAPAAQANLANGDQAVLRGTGRWRSANGTRNFTYSCNVNLLTAEATGVVVQDSAPASAPVRRSTEPELGNLSPAACESRAAVALKQRWPRVSQISFESATRRLLQDASGRPELRGQGRALPAPDSPFSHFGFECVFDPRDGRVLSTRISG